MNFTLEIKCDNAAFREDDGTETYEARGAEVARILRHLAKHIEEGAEGTNQKVLDVNGNTVGQYGYHDKMSTFMGDPAQRKRLDTRMT